MIRSTFFGFTTALRGMNASQKALDVTGQNITNIHTFGYTRQRVDLYSSASGFADKYATRPSTAVGQGADIGGISQLRDPFLDVRFRREACKLGQEDAKLDVLNGLESIFDETMSDGLENQISDFIKQLQGLSKNTGNAEFDGIAKASAEVLTKLFNQYAKQVETVREQQQYQLNNVDIPKVNDVLKSIANLNQTIRDNELHGNPALELRDQRNQLIDELSTYMKIDVSYTPKEIAPGIVVNDVAVNLIGENDTPVKLVENEKFGQFTSTTDSATNKTQIKMAFDGGAASTVDNHLTIGVLKGSLDMLNKAGEFDNPPNTTRGIGYYAQMLDTIATTFANKFNEANKAPNPAFDASKPEDPITNPKLVDRPLFESNDGNPLSAKNLSIAKDWTECKYGITASKKDSLGGNNSGAADNILYMITLFSQKFEYKTPAGVDLFKGTLQECVGQAKNVLALDVSSTEKILKNYATVVSGIDDLRAGISSVSLDEEGVNLLKYQKSYNAAARLMTTLDEAIDTIINKLGVVGR